MAGRSVRTFPGVSLSLSFRIKAALQNPWRERRERLKHHARASTGVTDGLIWDPLTRQWNRGCRRPDKRWQRVQMRWGRGRLPDPPIPRWTDWPETHTVNIISYLWAYWRTFIDQNESRMNKVYLKIQKRRHDCCSYWTTKIEHKSSSGSKMFFQKRVNWGNFTDMKLYFALFH